MSQFPVLLLNEVSSVAWWRHQAMPTYSVIIASSVAYVERRWRFSGYAPCTEFTGQGNDFELIPTVKWQLHIPYRDHLVMNIRRSVIITELWRPEVGRRWLFVWKFCGFLKKRPLGGNFPNSVTKVFTASPVDVSCSNFVKFGRREIGKVVRYLPDKEKQNFA